MDGEPFGTSWNVKVGGALPKAPASVRATCCRVDGATALDAAVCGAQRVGELFKSWHSQHARCEPTTSTVPLIRRERSAAELPRWHVELRLQCGAAEVEFVAVFHELAAVDTAAAIALAGALLGRQLAVDPAKIEDVELVEARVAMAGEAPQRALFPKPRPAGELPPLEVAPGCQPGDICECGHQVQRHEGVLDFGTGEVPGPCTACAVTMRSPAQRCAGFVSRDPADLMRRWKQAELDRVAATPTAASAPTVRDGVLEVPTTSREADAESLRAAVGRAEKRARGRRDRTGEPADVTPPPSSSSGGAAA